MDAVIFVSSGVTGAIHKLIHAMNMQRPPVSLFYLQVRKRSLIFLSDLIIVDLIFGNRR